VYGILNMPTNLPGNLRGLPEWKGQLARFLLPVRELREPDTSPENECQYAGVDYVLAAELGGKQSPKPGLRQTSAGNAHKASLEKVFVRRD
jgi:hypothetical protein